VRRDLHPGTAGGPRDAQSFGDAAPSQVRLHDAHGVGADKRRQFEMRPIRLAQRHGRADARRQSRVRPGIFRREGRLEPHRPPPV
jgi:hypothetical protein